LPDSRSSQLRAIYRHPLVQRQGGVDQLVASVVDPRAAREDLVDESAVGENDRGVVEHVAVHLVPYLDGYRSRRARNLEALDPRRALGLSRARRER